MRCRSAPPGSGPLLGFFGRARRRPGSTTTPARRAWVSTPGAARRTTRFEQDRARTARRTRVGGRRPTAVRRSGRPHADSGATHSGRFSRWIGTNGSPRAPDCISSSCTGGRPRRRRPRKIAGGWRRLHSSATAAITEQLLCASAATVVMCNHRGACACGRGLDSGFVSAIKFYRARMGLSVRSDVAGGIFSFK